MQVISTLRAETLSQQVWAGRHVYKEARDTSSYYSVKQQIKKEKGTYIFTVNLSTTWTRV